MVNVIADASHTRLVTHENQHVWGNLYAGNGSSWMLRPWKRQYNNFVDHIVKMYKAGNSWIASTDVVSFYDTVDHHTLLQFVRKYCEKDNRFLELLESCLSKWASHSNDTSMSRGIPQGSNASDYLANLYLYEIDQRMIVKGHQYVRYVDDIRILGKDKATVQRGLIEFDLELKKYGLVAQVSKTSVHQIEDIEKEITRLKFWVTDPSNESTHEDKVSIPRSEQASSVKDFINNSQNVTDADFLEGEENDTSAQEHSSVDDNTSAKSVHNQLYEQFLDAYENLDDPERGKEANTKITYCLNRLFRRDDIREKVLSLLERIPWRSEAVTRYLALFKDDSIVIDGLTDFVEQHEVYYWHRANALEALAQVSTPKHIASICREWIADEQQAWYCKIVATRLLAKVAGQHSFLLRAYVENN
ncbi:RNA-directed DNA polymerase [bacterium]|nr:RNA-directed DNA polymerase [bacterium]